VVGYGHLRSPLYYIIPFGTDLVRVTGSGVLKATEVGVTRLTLALGYSQCGQPVRT
jgi:hypothetical protein